MSVEQPQKKIIHIDMDCFYAAVEMRDNPELRDVPIAVGGEINAEVWYRHAITWRVNLVCAVRCQP
ncbi:DNA polymerase IV [Vibrio astriarenae]|nr:DNA polymerase IV [Vibrio sp. C7]